MLRVHPPISELNILPENKEARLVVCVSGTSESGKSAFGNWLFEHGVANRIKYLRVANELGAEKYGYSDPFRFLKEGDEQERAENAVNIWKRIVQLTENRSRISVVETIKHPHLLHALGSQSLSNIVSLTIFFDADFDTRVAREAKRLGVDEDTVRESTRQKDVHKYVLGLEAVRSYADISVQNNGDLDEYMSWVSDFGNQVANSFPNLNKTQTAIEYS